jgi:hypothetical protein
MSPNSVVGPKNIIWLCHRETPSSTVRRPTTQLQAHSAAQLQTQSPASLWDRNSNQKARIRPHVTKQAHYGVHTVGKAHVRPTCRQYLRARKRHIGCGYPKTLEVKESVRSYKYPCGGAPLLPLHPLRVSSSSTQGTLPSPPVPSPPHPKAKP